MLITGESGSGKELVANALHKHSPRASGPFVAINTAAIPKDLLESELFGHERGAFTGAQTTRRGRFEQADGGTLFLDEIGDMPFDLQTRLLRVLVDGQFYRVGGHNPMKSSVRVIAATHQNLEERVKAGSFREDLFHRLNVIRLRLPALRERLEDVPSLTRFFLQKSATRARRRGQAHHRRGARAADALRLSRQRAPAREHLPLADGDGAGQVIDAEGPAAGAAGAARRAPRRRRGRGRASPSSPPLRRRQWPRPVCAERWVDASSALCLQRRLPRPRQRPRPVTTPWLSGLERDARTLLEAGEPMVWETMTRKFEAQLIHTALEITRGRRIEAAQKLGIGRNTITRKIQELGLED